METIRDYWPNLIQGSILTWLGAVVINLLFLYLPTYLTTIHSYPKSKVALFNAINLIAYGVLLILISWLSDKVGRKWILALGAFGFILLGYPLFYALSQQSNLHLISAMIMITILSSCTTIYPSILAELFPTPIRYTAIAFSYNLGFAIFGSITPFIATYLIKLTGNKLAPSFYLIASAAVCLISLLRLKDKHKNFLN